MSAITESGAIAARCGGCAPRDEELADAGERDADHADLAVLHPRLRGDGLDDVVAVGGGRQVEESITPPEQPEPRMLTPTVA